MFTIKANRQVDTHLLWLSFRMNQWWWKHLWWCLNNDSDRVELAGGSSADCLLLWNVIFIHVQQITILHRRRPETFHILRSLSLFTFLGPAASLQMLHLECRTRLRSRSLKTSSIPLALSWSMNFQISKSSCRKSLISCLMSRKRSSCSSVTLLFHLYLLFCCYWQDTPKIHQGSVLLLFL